MASWSEVAAVHPEFAQIVRARFDAYKHKTLATLRKNGSPRISGVEATFAAGEVWLGMMPGSAKALDLLRDQRFALHSGTVESEMSGGDAKLAGRALHARDEASREAFLGALAGSAPSPELFDLFRLDISEVVLIRLGDPADHLVIETWSEDGGFRRVERR